MSDLFSPFSVLRGARSADEVLRSRHVAGALFRRFARRNAALCPRRRSSTCAVARNGKHRSPTSDEVPQVKVENRKTAVPFARARVRVCQSVSVFCLHLFTHMPQNFDSQINRGEGFAQNPPHFAFSSGLFLRQSAVFQRFVPYHHKKWEIRSMSATAGTTARCAFFEQGFGRRHNAQPLYSGGLRSTFLPIGARLGMADGANFYRDLG